MIHHTTNNIKKRLQKINLLFNIFEKEGLDTLSAVEKSLLLEQIELLKSSVLEIDENKEKPVGMSLPKVENDTEKKLEKEIVTEQMDNAEESRREDNLSQEPHISDEVIESSPSESVNETISAQLRNMRDVIDLNKSFIFKAELFKNNIEAYNKFVDELNNQMTEEDALSLVHDYANKNAWDKEEKVFALLLRTVEKRFLPLLG